MQPEIFALIARLLLDRFLLRGHVSNRGPSSKFIKLIVLFIIGSSLIEVPANASEDKTAESTDITEAIPSKTRDPANTQQPNEPVQPLIAEAAGYLKKSQEGISNTVIVLANKVDALFGNTRALGEYYDSTFVVTPKSYINTLGVSSYDLQSNLNLSLPNVRYAEERIRKWWQELGETEDESSKVTKKEFKDLNPWEYGQGVGVRLTRPPAYNFLARASKNFMSTYFVHHFTETIKWDSERLWEESTSLLSDYAFTKKLLFRFLNEAGWGISAGTFATQHGPSFIYNIDKVSVTSFDIRLFSGLDHNILYTQNYAASVTYRTSLHPLDWCFIQITPEWSWPRTNDFKSVWTIYVTLDMVFGRKR